MPDMISETEPSGMVLDDSFFLMTTLRPGSLVLNEAAYPPHGPEPSALVKASPLLMACLQAGMPLGEVERRALGAIRLSEEYSSTPWHTRRAAANPDYWNEFYTSCVNS